MYRTSYILASRFNLLLLDGRRRTWWDVPAKGSKFKGCAGPFRGEGGLAWGGLTVKHRNGGRVKIEQWLQRLRRWQVAGGYLVATAVAGIKGGGVADMALVNVAPSPTTRVERKRIVGEEERVRAMGGRGGSERGTP